MRILTVYARAFGPLIDKTLDLAEGMTIIHGPNEAGKSSWHAAIYAGLCGQRRGRGAGRREDQEFRTQFKPWSTNDWEVGARVVLDDGRTVELRHDLSGRVDCSARDAVLGRDYSSEIITDGAPDGSKWLGLTRKTFLSVACVRQSDVLGVHERAGDLQSCIEQATASLSPDQSVTSAIERLEQYRREQVGVDAANAVRPLRRALERVQRAEKLLAEATAAQSQYLALTATVDAASATAQQAQQALTSFQARRACSAALELQTRLARAQELASEFPDGPPPSVAADEALVQQVATAMQAWETRPPEPNPAGETSEELARRLASLPARPIGDLEPAANVRAAFESLKKAEAFLQLHDANRPQRPTTSAASNLAPERLRELAAVLEEPDPRLDPTIAQRYALIQGPTQPSSRSSATTPLAIAAAGLAVVGLLAVLAGYPAVGAPLLLIAILLGVWLAVSASGARHHNEDQQAELARQTAEYLAAAWSERRRAALQQLEARNLPTEARALKDLANATDAATRATLDLEQWQAQRATRATTRAEAEQALLRALCERGEPPANDAANAYAAYAQACTTRRDVAARAAQRSYLEQQLTARRALEETAAAARTRREQAERQLRAAGTAIGTTERLPDGVLKALRAWQATRQQSLQVQTSAQQHWIELQSLLGQGTLDNLRAAATRQAAAASQLAKDIDPRLLAAAPRTLDPAEEARLRDQAQRAQSDLDTKRGQLEERQRTLPSVAEADENLQSARAELQRVQQLSSTLDTTLTFLREAQDRVHRDVAPVLASAVRDYLPAVTAQRYVDVRIDPHTLDMSVLAPDNSWRDVMLLSHGTAEQLYLLLRVALAEHLTKPTERCPLILDDVTVHCDTERKRAVLETLFVISRQRQVIVFSHEREALVWAESKFKAYTERECRIVQLPTPARQATALAAGATV